MHDEHAPSAGAEALEDEAIDHLARLGRGEAVQVHVSLPCEVTPAQTADHAGVEADDDAFDTYSRVSVMSKCATPVTRSSQRFQAPRILGRPRAGESRSSVTMLVAPAALSYTSEANRR